MAESVNENHQLNKHKIPIKGNLVGGFNPFEKILVNMGIFPK